MSRTLIPSTDIVLKRGDLIATGGLREGREEYMLTRDIVYELNKPGSGIAVLVPAGYVTDRFSLPGLLKAWQPAAPCWLLPALVHDWLYEIGLCGKPVADFVLRDAMKAAEAKRLHRWAAWIGVTLGGHRGWAKPTPINLHMVVAARRQGLHRWAVNRAERYDALLPRLNSIRAKHGLPALKELRHADAPDISL